MRRSAALAGVALAGLIVATTATASTTPAPSSATTPPPPAAAPGDIKAALTQALELGQAGDCAGVLRLLDPLVPALAAGPDRSAAQLLRLSCLGPAGRGGELPAVQSELAVALPRNGTVRTMGVLVAASEGKFDDAAERLATLATDDPRSLALIPADSWRGIAQALEESGKVTLRDKVVVALARADWQPADRPELRDSLAQGAIGALLGEGQTTEAGLLLDRIQIPELLTGMAEERLYQPLWPAIEARMGPGQAKAADRFATARLDAFARTPDDPWAMRDAVRAFMLLGRFPEASEIARQIAIAPGMDEDAVTIVRYDAEALQAAGRTDAAIARLRPFAAIDPAATPATLAGRIELAETLDETGHEAEALTVASATLAAASDALSPWAIVWLRRTETCALAALGRAPEARAAGDRLKTLTDQNPAAATEGLLCAGRTDEAAAIAVAALSTTDGASNIADQFQPDGAIWASSPSRLRALWGRLLVRPEVRAAFEKRARVLPRSLWPARTPQPILRGADDAPGADTT